MTARVSWKAILDPYWAICSRSAGMQWPNLQPKTRLRRSFQFIKRSVFMHINLAA